MKNDAIELLGTVEELVTPPRLTKAEIALLLEVLTSDSVAFKARSHLALSGVMRKLPIMLDQAHD